jgi:predicted metal-dependent HD superfamily phosphohydrolase
MFEGPLALPGPQQAALQHAYATPPRQYHDLGHVAEVLRHYRDVAAGPGWAQPREVWLAVLYHDAVYRAGRRDNEALSAAMAREHVDCWLSQGGVDATRVARLIELTARHGTFAPGDFDADTAPDDVRHFLDCDMAILGADAAVFDAYDAGIGQEYRGHVPGPLFRLNRRRFLKHLLARERIFLSDWFHQRYDAAARGNLRRVLQG